MAPAVYVVTGASRGLGLEFVKQLLERGDQVVATARNPKASRGLEELAEKFPKALSLVPLDVSVSSSIKDAAEDIMAACPDGIDVLINNAGITGDLHPTIQQSEEHFRDVLFTNVVGPFMVVKALLPLIKKGNKKQIVQISSGLGSISTLLKQLEPGASPHPAARCYLAYKVSKAALNMETAALAVDLKQDGITVVSLCPGWVATDMGSRSAAAFGGPGPDLKAPQSIGGMLKLMDNLSIEQSGGYFNYEGKTVPF